MARTNNPKPREAVKSSGKTENRPRRAKPVEPDPDPASDEVEDEDHGYSSPSVLETGDADADGADIGSDLDDEDEDGSSSEEDEEEETTDDEATATALQSRMSFGTLAKVQDTLGDDKARRKRKRGVEDEEGERKLRALRERLRELKEKGLEKKGRVEDTAMKKAVKGSRDTAGTKGIDRPISSADSSSDDSDEEEEEDDTENGQPTKKKGRTSKHAPTEMSSKRAVTRRRSAVEMKKSTVRDPRFDPLSGAVDHHVLSKKYAFLDEYRASELATLKQAMKNKKLKDEEREAMKRQVVSMESKIAFEKSKAREARIVREHRREERKRVEQGKGVWHVKKSVVRQEALRERFEGMKGRQRDKVIERRRKKLTAKERRGMPEERRG
ncbi:hypothetical protein FKW77_007010 [Venturia effusa]|uniref:rRNA biogenesis protein RRP36 n=1 Tax=Venturia effusa TaxID=50376 RepID=A0A517LN35_9PEZI|nr:hypothetical protein FKW77_007010 [Venturia effusa]